MVSVDVKRNAAKNNANAGIKVVLDESNSTRCENSHGPCTRRALNGWDLLQGTSSKTNFDGNFWLYIGKLIFTSYALYQGLKDIYKDY